MLRVGPGAQAGEGGGLQIAHQGEGSADACGLKHDVAGARHQPPNPILVTVKPAPEVMLAVPTAMIRSTAPAKIQFHRIGRAGCEAGVAIDRQHADPILAGRDRAGNSERANRASAGERGAAVHVTAEPIREPETSKVPAVTSVPPDNEFGPNSSKVPIAITLMSPLPPMMTPENTVEPLLPPVVSLPVPVLTVPAPQHRADGLIVRKIFSASVAARNRIGAVLAEDVGCARLQCALGNVGCRRIEIAICCAGYGSQFPSRSW